MVNYNKLSSSELKESLKKIGMVQSGDKGTLIYRLELYDKCKNNNLKTISGDNPCFLKMAALKIAVSKAGISPIGTQDELLSGLIEYLMSNNTTTSSSNTSTSASDTTNNDTSSTNTTTNTDGVSIAKSILLLDEEDDDEGILNILGPDRTAVVTSTSLTSVMRKNYLKISLLIHPDKIGRLFGQATKAFQALVKAFERMSAAERMAEDTKQTGMNRAATPGVAQLARSNEGCHRTRVCCPRCKQPWSERDLEGNPEYFYNLLMMGLKRYTCATCLCEFGCVTAIHKCPSCKERFEYNPSQYHNKISCGNIECRSNSPRNPKLFGFMMYHVPPRVLTGLKDELKVAVEARIKSRETKRRRAERAGGCRGNASTVKSSITNSTNSNSNTNSNNKTKTKTYIEDEQAYCLGLIDACPRCGEYLESYSKANKRDKTELTPQRIHLNHCNDSKKHAEYNAKQAKKSKQELKKHTKIELEEDTEGLAAWEFLGSKEGDMWRLTDKQIDMHANKLGLLGNGNGNGNDSSGGKTSTKTNANTNTNTDTNSNTSAKTDRFDLLGKIRSYNNGDTMLLESSSSGNSGGGGGDSKSTALVLSTNNTNKSNKSNKDKAKTKANTREQLISSLPHNLHQSSTIQLKSICILHGLYTNAQCESMSLVKSDYIEEIERVMDGRDRVDTIDMTTNTTTTTTATNSNNSSIAASNSNTNSKRKRKRIIVLDSSDESDYNGGGDGDDSDY